MAPPNECQKLQPGDIAIFLLTSDDPDAVASFPLEFISDKVGSIYITKNAWTGTELAQSEATIEVCVCVYIQLRFCGGWGRYVRRSVLTIEVGGVAQDMTCFTHSC